MGEPRRTAVARLAWLSAVVAVTLTVVSGGVADAGPRPFGDAKILAQVPTPPGYPEGIAYTNNLVLVAGPATFGTAGGPPSQVLMYSATSGLLLKTFPTKGENLAFEHANSSIALDRANRVYVLNTQLGIYRLSLNGKQEQYSTPFPDLKPCNSVPAGEACSPTPFDAPPLPNDIVFDAAGNAYVTDSTQATIWIVPAGGGTPQIWFQDVRLASTFIGVNGIRLNPARTRVFFTVTADLANRAFVYSLPLVAHPSASKLKVVHEYTNGDAPDGIAFGASGRLYVAIATPFASGVSILSPNGVEVARLTNPQNSPLYPYDSPANIAFDGKGSILLTNHAFATGGADPGQFTILDVWVNDTGDRLEKPLIV